MRGIATALGLILTLGACGESDPGPDVAVGVDGSADAQLDTGALDAAGDVLVDASGSDAPTSDVPSSDVRPSDGLGDVTDAGPRPALSEPGCFFTPDEATRSRDFEVGDSTTTYSRAEVQFDVVAGPYRPHITDPSNRTEHLLFGFARANQPRSFERYLMGAAAVDFESRPDHFRMFGRTAIESGFTSYTQVSAVYRGWAEGTRYTLRCSIDAVAGQQLCELSRAGELEASRMLDVTFLDPEEHFSSGFILTVGEEQPLDHDHLQSPLGWQFCDLEVYLTE